MEIHVKSQNNNEGISQAIMRKLVEAGGDKSKINKNASLWSQIIAEFNKDAESTVESSDGKKKKTLSEAFKENMTVFSNYVIRIKEETWNKMLDMVKGLGNFTEGKTSVDDTKDGDETIEQQVKTPEGKYTTSSIKVNAPKQKYASQDSDVREIYSAREEGKKLEADLRKGKTDELRSANVAYAFGKDINFGPNTQDQAFEIFVLLQIRMEDLDFEDIPTKEEFKALSYKEQNNLLHKMRNLIIEADNKIIKNVNAEKLKYNAEQEKVQETFDEANQLLVDVANEEYAVQIKQGQNVEGNYNWKRAVLSNGRWIEVIYDDQGEISKIKISYDTTPDHINDGTSLDGAEVSYTGSKAYVNTSHDNGEFEHSITSGYDFEKLKAVAEAIFGKWEEE